MNNNCKIIAECGCNHQGDINIAKEMIKQAYLCEADYIKFQKRDINSHPEWDRPYNSKNSFGETYKEHRQFLEFTIEQHKELKEYCEEIGIGYACSVWDIQSAKDIISLDLDYIKVPSAKNNDYDLLNYIYNNYDKQVHLSLGMTTRADREELYIRIPRSRTVLYWCTSDYPAKFKDLFLLEIPKIDERFNVGYSGHHNGIAVDIVAYMLGVKWIERHFTLDRTLKGTDHAASLEPMGLQKLCRDIKAVKQTLTFKND